MSERIKAAEQLARRAHEGQKRKYSGEPYIVHPEAVAMRASKIGGLSAYARDTLCAAAWLHDVLEDCPEITEQEILDECGREVLDLVKELTNPSKGMKAPRAERKRIDREHITKASAMARALKKIDRTCNLRDILHEEADQSFLRLYLKESRDLYDAISGGSFFLDNEFAQAIWELEAMLSKERKSK